MTRYTLNILFLLLLLFPQAMIATDRGAPPGKFLPQQETVVYITKTGEKYHRDGCRYLSQSKIKVSRAEAVKNGFQACKVCKP